MIDKTKLLTNLGVVLGVGLFVALVAWGPLRGSGPTTAPEPATSNAAPTPTVPALEPAPPRRIAIPALGVDAAVVDVVVGADLTLRPPRTPDLVGWWSGGARPGDSSGATVIAGHTVHTGGGALDDLARLRPGQALDVTTEHGTLRYRVEHVTSYDKDELAARTATLFDRERAPRLVVVTCADWDGTAYRSNVVAVARPAVVRPAAAHSAAARPNGGAVRLPA